MLAHVTQRNGVNRGGLLVLFDGKYDSDLSRSGHHPRLCHGHDRHLGIECFRDPCSTALLANSEPSVAISKCLYMPISIWRWSKREGKTNGLAGGRLNQASANEQRQFDLR